MGGPLFSTNTHSIGCPGKTRYSSEASARRAAQDAVRSGRDNCPDRLFVYPCGTCRRWHLSKRENSYGAVTSSDLNTGAAA